MPGPRGGSASNGGGLWAFEVDESGGVSLSGQLGSDAGFTSVAVHEGLAFLGDPGSWALPRGGLVIARVTNTGRIERLGSLSIPGNATDVFIAGELAYVTSARSGLRVVDVADPSLPVEIGFADTPDNAEALHVSGRHAYVADRAGGLRVLDVGDPSAPTEIGSLTFEDHAWGLDVVGPHVFVAAGFAGLRIVSVECEGRTDAP